MDFLKDPSMCCLQEIHFRAKGTQRLKGQKVREKDTLCKQKWQESVGNNFHTGKKCNFKAKAISNNKEGHYIMMKVSTWEEDIC